MRQQQTVILNDSLRQIRDLLNHYTKYNSIILRFITGAWNRTHLMEVNRIVNDINSGEHVANIVHKLNSITPLKAGGALDQALGRIRQVFSNYLAENPEGQEYLRSFMRSESNHFWTKESTKDLTEMQINHIVSKNRRLLQSALQTHSCDKLAIWIDGMTLLFPEKIDEFAERLCNSIKVALVSALEDDSRRLAMNSERLLIALQKLPLALRTRVLMQTWNENNDTIFWLCLRNYDPIREKILAIMHDLTAEQKIEILMHQDKNNQNILIKSLIHYSDPSRAIIDIITELPFSKQRLDILTQVDNTGRSAIFFVFESHLKWFVHMLKKCFSSNQQATILMHKDLEGRHARIIEEPLLQELIQNFNAGPETQASSSRHDSTDLPQQGTSNTFFSSSSNSNQMTDNSNPTQSFVY